MSKATQKQFTTAEAKKIGDRLGIDWEKIDLQQFRIGLNVELEYGLYNPITNFASDDPLLAGKIVRAHLNDAPDYYTQVAQMEKDAEVEHDRKQTAIQKKKTELEQGRKRTTAKTAKAARARKPKLSATGKGKSKTE